VSVRALPLRSPVVAATDAFAVVFYARHMRGASTTGFMAQLCLVSLPVYLGLAARDGRLRENFAILFQFGVWSWVGAVIAVYLVSNLASYAALRSGTATEVSWCRRPSPCSSACSPPRCSARTTSRPA
jgi:hypothetical protein